MVQIIVELVPVVFFALILGLGMSHSLQRIRRPPQTFSLWEGPAFLRWFGWATIFFGLSLILTYSLDRTDPVQLLIGIALMVVGVKMIISPSYSQQGESERRNTDALMIVSGAVVAIYAALSLLMGQFVGEPATTAFQVTVVCGLMAWMIWRLLGGTRPIR
ncbi:MAG: hypothetical protein ABSC13_08485 [Dehalococcoidia bacterium]|jgi:drug/metabolite transporter (DMT)-like permease